MTSDASASSPSAPGLPGALLLPGGGLSEVVFAALPAACLLLTPELRIVAVSDAYLALTLIPRARLVGQQLFDAFTARPGTREAATLLNLQASLQQALATGQPQPMPVQPYGLPDPAASGTQVERFWQPHNTPVFAPDGQLCGLLHTVTDVTATHRATALVQQSLAREQAAYQAIDQQHTNLRELLDQTPVAIGLLQGPDFRVQQANPALCAIWGRPGASVVGRPFFEALPDLRGQGFEELFTSVLARHEPLVLREVPVNLAPDPQQPPRTGFFNCVYQPWQESRSRQPGLMAVAVDVTEQVLARRKAEDQQRLTTALNVQLQAANEQLHASNATLERTQQQLRQLNQELEMLVFERTQALRHAVAATEREREELYQVFEQTPVAITIMRGPNLRVELVNPAAGAIWGRPAAQVLGRPYFEAVPDTAGQGLEQLLANVLATGQPFTIREAPVMLAREHTGQPGQAYVNFVFQPLHDTAGATVGLVASGAEVTEQVLARRQLEKLNQELEARVQERTQAAQLAQAEAEAGRATLQHVFEQAPVALCILEGPDHLITLANAEMGLIWGRDPATLLGRPHFEALPDLAGQGFEAIFADVYHTGRPYYLRELPVVVHRAGGPVPGCYHITYQPFRNGQGHITAIIASAIDVTDQVLSRQQMQRVNEQLEEQVLVRTHQVRQHSQRLDRLITEAPAAICTLGGPELVCELVNSRYQALFPDRHLTGQPLLAVLPELVGSPVAALLQNVYQTGVSFEGQEMQLTFARPGDGRPEDRYFNFICQARYDTAGAIDGLVVFAFDVTGQVLSRRRTETLQAAILAAAQRRAQERQDLLNLFEQAPVAVLLLREPDHQLEYYNRQFEHMYPGPLRRGAPIATLPAARMTPAMRSRLDGVYQTGVPYHDAELLQAGTTPGSTRYVSFTCQAYRENDRVAGVAVFIYDVTAQVLARQQVQALNGELRATNQELHLTNSRLTRTNADLDTFVYTASHDLKVPIANIEGLLDALNRDLLEQPAPESVPLMLHMMKQAVSRFQQTIGHLTEISRLQPDEVPAPETVSLATVVADVQLDLAPLIQTTGAHLAVDLGEAPALPLSPKNLRSLVYNLLSNALKYRSPARPPRIRISSEQQGHTVVLQVQDNGLGLAEHQQQRLFGLFQRLHTHEEGSGVGLYMVRKIAENAGGFVRVQSTEGVGSTFSVTIPLSRTAYAARP